MAFHRKWEHFVDFPGFKTKTKEMWWFPMSFTLRFWVCSSFHAQNETWEVKTQSFCHESEQNVPTNFMWKKPQSNLRALERCHHATRFPLLSQGFHVVLQPWNWLYHWTSVPQTLSSSLCALAINNVHFGSSASSEARSEFSCASDWR